MGLPFDALQDKRFLIAGLAITAIQGGRNFQGLLDELSVKELRILRKHPDLVVRVREIAGMAVPELLDTISGEYRLDPVDCHNGQVWIGTGLLEDNIPSWVKTEHCGWIASLDDGGFETWAQQFLVQEVRINIWIRYMEHKKKNPIRQGEPSSGHGTYL